MRSGASRATRPGAGGLPHAQYGDFCVPLPHGGVVGGKLLGDQSSPRAVVYFHGFPGSRVEALLSHKQTLKRGLRIVAIDRPGIGLSSRQPDRPIEEVVADQLFALEALGIQRFSIIAVSGGTPHALALREQARDRVIKTALVSGLWNPTDPAILATMNRANRTFLQMGYRYPALTRLAVGCIATTWRFAPALAAIWFAIWLPKADRAIIRRREVAVVMAANLQQALCSGVSGVCQEFSRIAARHAVPSAAAQGSLQIWHGGDDDYVPISMGQALARHTSAPFVLVPNAGHFMVIDIIDQIFDWLTE